MSSVRSPQAWNDSRTRYTDKDCAKVDHHTSDRHRPSAEQPHMTCRSLNNHNDTVDNHQDVFSRNQS